MIEKRTMWMVDYNHELVQVTVLYDFTEKKVMSYTQGSGNGGSFLSINRGAHFFNTKNEAEAWLSKRRAKLRELMPKVYDFLHEMSNLSPNEDFDYKRSITCPIITRTRMTIISAAIMPARRC